MLEPRTFDRRTLGAALLGLVCSTSAIGQPLGAVISREEAAVQTATMVLDEVMAIPARSIPQALLANANGIAIIPNVLKGGFVVGVRHGRGVVLIRDQTGAWQPPMFVSLTSGSVGWQAGVQATDLILVFQTPRSVQSLLRGRMTIGVDAAAAAGPVGRQATASTDTAFQAEILSYSRSRGLFAGFAVDGAAIQIDGAAGAAYYRQAGGLAVGPTLPPSAAALVDRLNRYAGAPAVVGPPPGQDRLRPQLNATWQRLSNLLDPQWATYLQPPPEGPEASAATLAAVIQRYEFVVSDPRYRALAERPEFGDMYRQLRQLLAAQEAQQGRPLPLPAPPDVGPPARQRQ